VNVWESPLPYPVNNCDWNTITQNSIYWNGFVDPGYLGIDLQEDWTTPNDLGDPDEGPNIFINFPVITGIINNVVSVTVNGTLDLDTPENQATVELFQVIPGAPGYGQGAVYLGNATPNAAGVWSITVAGIYGTDWVTTTATDWIGNTSEFSLNMQVPGEPPEWDFGDAMDPTYPTLLANNGARHLCGSVCYLGGAPDSEPDGQPTPMCDGDDLNGVADEDGVMFTHMFIAGQQTSLTVFASVNGVLDMWIDFGADGSWAQPGDQVCTAYPLVPGANVLNFTVPTGSAINTQTSSRFRFNTWGPLATTGSCNHGEVEDWDIPLEDSFQIDYGDAPDPSYPTLFASNGASHVITTGLFLGSSVDGEFDGQPNASATGDDLNGVDDEDGITFTTLIYPGQPYTVQIVATIPQQGVVSAWIDFDGNGSWAEASDNIFPAGQTVVNGINTFTLTAPATAVAGSTYARFRLSFANVLTPTGQHWCGEVEDYEVDIEGVQQLDYGDAPDPTYPTLLASNGARHLLGSGLYMGAQVDAETDGQPDATATGDDLANSDDEDGVTFTTSIMVGQPFTFQVVASMPGLLDAWIDFDGNGTWADPPDRILTAYPVVTGTNNITITAPGSAVAGWSFARFRISTQGGISYTGYQSVGEVEDYQVEIEEAPDLDYGDAPDPTYPTLLANNGARHIYDPTIFLGNLIDIETDGQPNATATGDDIAALADEDGVTLSALVPGRNATVTVTASANGFLNAWMDFNTDGDWADQGEQIFTDAPLAPGVNALTFMVPAGALQDTTFSRWRYDTVGGLTYTGLAPDGEVEDYMHIIRCGVVCPINSNNEAEVCGTLQNQGCNNPADPQFTYIACWDTVCAETWADTNWRDTDWYELNVPVPMRVRWTIASDIPLQYGFVEPITPGYVDCDSLTGAIDPWAYVAACGTSTLEIDLTAAGTYWFVVGPQVFNGYPCDEGPWLYYHYMDCLGLYIEVTITYDGTNITLEWNAVEGTDRYMVYSSSDPYAAFPVDWTLETPGGVATPTWSETYPGGIKFYRVVAVMDVLARSSTPEMDLKLIPSDKQLK